VDDLTRYSLTGATIASTLGGVVLCALILKYGLAPPEEAEYPPLARRRVMLVHVGHAIAAVCFAATALLVVVALSVAPAARSAADSPAVRRLEHDVRALDDRLGGVEDVLGRVGSAVDDLAARLDPSASPGPIPSLPPRRREPGR
jgi:hypothetical protein